ETRQKLRLISEARAFHVEAHHMLPQVQRVAVVICQPVSAGEIDQPSIELGYDGALERPVSYFYEVGNNDIGSAARTNDLVDRFSRLDVVAGNRPIITAAAVKRAFYEIEGKPAIDFVPK